MFKVITSRRAGIYSISLGGVSCWRMQTAQCSSSTAQTIWGENDITLYQYKICPFCNRAKAYMDYNRIPYKSVEVNPLTKQEISFSQHKPKKVPIAIMKDEIVPNSNSIVYRLQEDMKDLTDIAPMPEDTVKWMDWSEQKLAVLLYPNITKTFNESWEAFAYTADVESWSALSRWSNRLLGPLAMSFANGKIKAKYNIWDEKKDLKECLMVWTDALNGQKFLHGDKITIPDLMVYGVLNSIEGLQTFRDIMSENEVLSVWYRNVQDSIASRR